MNKQELFKKFRKLQDNCNNYNNCDNCDNCDNCNNCILCFQLKHKTSGYWLLNKEVTKKEFEEAYNMVLIS